MSYSKGDSEPDPLSDLTKAMTSSYHEIDESEVGQESDEKKAVYSAKSLFKKAKNWVGDLSLEGIVAHEGEPIPSSLEENVGNIDSLPLAQEASDLIESSNLTSPTSSKNEIINEIEEEAQKLAASVDSVTENLTGILHSVSSITLECVFTSSDANTQLCDTADASIKAMYQVMAKCEELNKSVHPIYNLHQQIKEVKRLLDKVEQEFS